jgi:peptidoglycan/xylan/chitin deacetylase (PgdA/CDA1 family)
MSLGGRISENLKRWSRKVCYDLGIENRLFSAQKKNADLILMYHNVLPVVQPEFNLRNIAAADFSKQLLYFKNKYNIVSLEEIYSSKSNATRIAITLDDGLVNNLRYALPVIAELQIPVTVFVTTSWLNGQNILWPDELDILCRNGQKELKWNGEIFRKNLSGQYMSDSRRRLGEVLTFADPVEKQKWMNHLVRTSGFDPSADFKNEDLWRTMKGEEIKILANSSFIEIGSHCTTHENLCLLSDEEVSEEMAGSKKYLETITNKTVHSVAFPFGQYNQSTLSLAERAGYSRLLAVNFLSENDAANPKLKARFGIYSDRSCTEQIHQVNQYFHG